MNRVQGIMNVLCMEQNGKTEVVCAMASETVLKGYCDDLNRYVGGAKKFSVVSLPVFNSQIPYELLEDLIKTTDELNEELKEEEPVKYIEVCVDANMLSVDISVLLLHTEGATKCIEDKDGVIAYDETSLKDYIDDDGKYHLFFEAEEDYEYTILNSDFIGRVRNTLDCYIQNDGIKEVYIDEEDSDAIEEDESTKCGEENPNFNGFLPIEEILKRLCVNVPKEGSKVRFIPYGDGMVAVVEC